MCKEYVYPKIWEGEGSPCIFTVVDVETTGLDSREDEVIEIGCVRVKVSDGIWEVLNQVNYLREPSKMPLSETIKEITGITEVKLTRF